MRKSWPPQPIDESRASYHEDLCRRVVGYSSKIIAKSRRIARNLQEVIISSVLFSLLSLGIILGLPSAWAQGSNDSSSVQATVHSFHEALLAGNVATVKQLLATDAVILENGHLESREEYLNHHLSSDIEFAKAVPIQILSSRVQVSGETAWVTSTTTSVGTFRNRPVKLAGVELVVLTRKGLAWEVRAIHWSSHQPK